MHIRTPKIALVVVTAAWLASCGGGGGSTSSPSTTPVISITVSPQSVTVAEGATQQFNASVSGTSNTSVTWSVNSVAGGDAAVGLITSTGLYTAPAALPSPNVVTVTATSAADASRSDSASVTVVHPAPTLSSISPSAVNAGSADLTLSVAGTGFVPESVVMAGTTSLATSFGSSTALTATVPAADLAPTGTFPITVMTPSPGGGTSGAATFSVVEPPAITSAAGATFTVGAAGSFAVTTTGYPSPTLSETGALPGGVTFAASTGALSGTPAGGTAGTYDLTFTASNGVTPNAVQSFTLTVDQPPAITSAASATFTVGAAGSFTVTATGYPSPTLSETGTLPGGVTFTASTGVLSGTPGASAGGTYNLTFTASNGAHADATQNFTLTVENPLPALYSVSPPGATAGDGNTALTVTGASFTGQSVVYANATALTTSYGNSAQLEATIPSTLLASTATLTLTVVSSAPGGGASNGVNFTIWPSYPRSSAGSVLNGPPPALTQVAATGTQVSVLDWTAKDNEGTPEDVLAADHLANELGIPNVDTTALATAATKPFVLVAGVLNTSGDLSAGEISSLTTYVNGGGTLYLWEPSVSGLLTALGLGAATEHFNAVTRPLTFDISQPDPLLSYINATEEVNWEPVFPSVDVTRGYAAGSCTPLATWDTGDYAALRCDIGTGRAYVFGWRLRPLLTLPERQLFDGPEPLSTNVPIVDADVCRMLMRGSYEAYASSPQERQWAPGGHHAALILTHDVDAIVAYQNVPAWVDLEQSLGVKSTYFFTTNPYDTGYIAPMYTPSGRADIQYALDHGFDVEDHSFGHFPDFYVATYSIGPPTEDATNYTPMFTSNPPGSLDCCTNGMSVLGEAGVSKWLLENDLGISVPTFRSGYLADPPELIQGLSDIGYRRDSTYALGLTRGSFPFVLFDVDDTVTPNVVTTYHMMEYPVTISEDQVPVLDSTTINDYLSKWETIIRINYDNNAPTVLLIHPIDTQIRFQIFQQLMTDLQNQGLDLWVGDMKTFAEFWEAQGVTNARWP